MQLLSRLALILHGQRAHTHQIPHRLVRRVRDPCLGQLTNSQRLRQRRLASISSIWSAWMHRKRKVVGGACGRRLYDRDAGATHGTESPIGPAEGIPGSDRVGERGSARSSGKQVKTRQAVRAAVRLSNYAPSAPIEVSTTALHQLIASAAAAGLACRSTNRSANFRPSSAYGQRILTQGLMMYLRREECGVVLPPIAFAGLLVYDPALGKAARQAPLV
jgi:hypothetical protein